MTKDYSFVREMKKDYYVKQEHLPFIVVALKEECEEAHALQLMTALPSS